MTYANLTFKDPNPFKRWLQRQRLSSAVRLCTDTTFRSMLICDFGAGNGELCKVLSTLYLNSNFICYEPTPTYLSEAQQNLNSLSCQVDFCQDIDTIAEKTVDLVFCLEVFEHLPPRETYEAIQKILRILKPEGKIIIGVPVEIGFPALYKGVFRMLRRYGKFDANIQNVIASFFLSPPKQRPVDEITPGFQFHHEHMGFDWRHLRKELGKYVDIRKISASPFTFLGHWLMPELYFLAEKPKI